MYRTNAETRIKAIVDTATHLEIPANDGNVLVIFLWLSHRASFVESALDRLDGELIRAYATYLCDGSEPGVGERVHA